MICGEEMNVKMNPLLHSKNEKRIERLKAPCYMRSILHLWLVISLTYFSFGYVAFIFEHLKTETNLSYVFIDQKTSENILHCKMAEDLYRIILKISVVSIVQW